MLLLEQVVMKRSLKITDLKSFLLMINQNQKKNLKKVVKEEPCFLMENV